MCLTVSIPDTMNVEAVSPAVAAAVDRLAEMAPGSSGPVLQDFARQYLRRVHDGPLTRLNATQLAAHVAGVFQFATERGLNPVSVRVFNPTLDRDGYECRGTVVEVSTLDRPFLVDSVSGEIQSRGIPVDYVVHPVIGTTRDEDGLLVSVGPARDADVRESVQHYELEQSLGPDEI
jgi:glutamate dehydrogenase